MPYFRLNTAELARVMSRVESFAHSQYALSPRHSDQANSWYRLHQAANVYVPSLMNDLRASATGNGSTAASLVINMLHELAALIESGDEYTELSLVENAEHPIEMAGGIGFATADPGQGNVLTAGLRDLWVEDDLTPLGERDDIVTEAIDNMVIVRPTPEVLEARLPVSARPLAFRILPTGAQISRFDNVEAITVDGVRGLRVENQNSIQIPTADSLIESGRQAYREWLRISMGRVGFDAEEAGRIREARRLSAERFAAFARRPSDTERHVPTLPFVPNGLSSSRRWGIEVEAAGARGVDAPEGWRRITDGSLRSAWDGYREVQDFEPYDETVTEYIRRFSCHRDHNPDMERYINGRYVWEANPNYTPAEGCTECGQITRVVRREPQTIVHTAQGGDCAEFVSPILVSMHSDGLKQITEALALQPQNNTAGVHVHVEADDLTAEQVATLIFGYDVLEPILEASYQREARRYCNRRGVESVLNMARALRRSGPGVTQGGVRGGDRYVTLNTTSLNQHGTIEFRAMGPVYEYDYLVRWAMLCRELVNITAAGVTTAQFSRIRTWNDLTMLLAEYGSEYMRAAVYEATGDTGHAADLVKRGATMTTEALDRDLQDLFAATTQATTRLAHWQTAWVDMAERGRALVGAVGLPSV